MPVAGKMRKVLLHPDRNSYLYVIDRTTGELLSADAYGPLNSYTGVDMKTGRPIVNPAKTTKVGIPVHDICPTAWGGKDWEPSAFSPITGLLYIPHENLCMDWEDVQTNYIEGTPYVGAVVGRRQNRRAQMALQNRLRNHWPAGRFKAPDGHEEVAILSGVGGWAGAIVSGNLDPKDPTGALGYVGVMGDLKQRTTPGGMLYVFDLPH